MTFVVLASNSAVKADPQPTASSEPPKGEFHVYHLATTLIRQFRYEKTREVLVYTPPGYKDPANAKTRYPVVYLLHGSPGNPRNFVKLGQANVIADRLIREKIIVPCIMVAPDGNYAGETHGDSEWINSADGKDLFEDYVANEVVAWTDQHYRTIPDPQSRVLAGVSEGGYGAVNIALRRPTVFARALSMSGYFLNDGSGWARPIMGHDQSLLDANSPLTEVTAKSAPVATWSASHFYLGAGQHEKRYTQETCDMSVALKNLGIDTRIDLMDGKHSWKLWNQLFINGLVTLLPASADAFQRLKSLQDFDPVPDTSDLKTTAQ
jgi:enterochelin esterase-like enzyme